jgi:hypothetical protein
MDHDNTLPPLPGDAQHPENALQMPVPLHFPPPPPPNPQAGLPVRSDSSHVSVVANAPLRTPIEKSPFEDADTLSARGSTPPDRREGGSIPAQSTREGAPSRRPRTVDTHMSTRRSGLDWIIPMEEKKEPVRVANMLLISLFI